MVIKTKISQKFDNNFNNSKVFVQIFKCYQILQAKLLR